MKTAKILFGILFISLLFAACEMKTDNEHSSTLPGVEDAGEGFWKTENWDLDPIKGIDLGFSANVTIRQDSFQSVKISAGANILKLISKDVDAKGMWEIDLDGPGPSGKWRRPEVAIVVKDLNAAKISGSGNITGEGVFDAPAGLDLIVSGSGDIQLNAQTGKAYFKVSGSGDIAGQFVADETVAKLSGSGSLNISGNSPQLEARISGSGELKAGDLVTKQADLILSGSGDAKIHVKELAKIKITGSGNVVICGDGKAESKITGSGKILRQKAVSCGSPM